MSENIAILSKIYESLPVFEGRLSVEKIYYDAARRAVRVFLFSDEPVGEEGFLAIKQVLKNLLPGIRVTLRTAAPGAADRFMKNPSEYGPDIIGRLLVRKFPAMVSWVGDILWKNENDRLVLEMPDRFSLDYANENAIPDLLKRAVYDIFRIEAPIELRLRDDADKRMRRIMDMRREEEEARREALQKENQDKEKQKPAAPAAKREGAGGHDGYRKIKGVLIKDPITAIETLGEESGLVAVEGRVISKERKDLPGKEMVLLTFIVCDGTGSIKAKIFLRYRNGWGKKNDEKPQPLTREEIESVEKVVEGVSEGCHVRLRGLCEYDRFEKDITISARDIMTKPHEERQDMAERKRVELHAHTQMSNMDATVSAGDLIKQAARWGHPGIAITDSGVVQAFPEAFGAAKKHGIKLIPGMEGYMVDEVPIVLDADGRSLDSPIVVFDFETTGLNPRRDRIIEVGAVKLLGDQIIDTFSEMVNPGMALPPKITEITGITDADVIGAEPAEKILPRFLTFIGDAVIAAHNAKFDCAFLKNELARMGKRFSAPRLDTLLLAQKLYPEMTRFRLGTLCRALHVSLKNAHRAVHDAKATGECLAIMLTQLKERGAKTLDDVDRLLPGLIKTARRHVCLLARTQKGMQNLNELVSRAHLDYFNAVPTIPKGLIKRHREGLLIGSACSEGEIFQAFLDGEPDEKIEELAAFYDYLEVQPAANHKALLGGPDGDGSLVKNEDEIREITGKIIALGEKLGKPVAATGDVHFMEKEDRVFRAVLQCSQNIRGYNVMPDVHFRTTDEMLEEFAYLGKEKAEEIVIDVPARILDMVEDVTLYPKHPENKTTFSPVWDTAEEDIRGMSMKRAHEMYGDPLPEIVDARLAKELKSIIGYGYATLYSIANKLVSNSLANGYLVGSRGSVGSSLVATMCGITEVNPLPPHYRCPKCLHSEFDVPKEYKVGVDLPEKECPVCGAQMKRDGFDIPFEVFLGFKGDKVPDIDLNFSGEYQGKAHNYVEELFGVGHVFRAGTIGTLQDKTAYGLVLKYLEKENKKVSDAEKWRLALGCVGVKRTTGQHPGGMVILPKAYEITQFTAVQHPADKMDQDIVTTHYDFSSMHDILVKLDILGHDDPTIIHMLEELTGKPYIDIPLSDPKVMSLFTSPEALGVTADMIGCETGTLGVPEFGTSFVRQMLLDTRPTSMEELIRISGLSHGTDVWLGNAKDIILSKTAQLKDCICIRDDIMNYLMSIGMPAKMSFDIMENVRKGKKLSVPEMESAMREGGVPEWFIESCKKIGYLFPKGHAVAYVTMALRIAWYKVYYPLAYYAAYFSIRCKGFDAKTMLCPIQYLKQMLREISERPPEEQQGKDKDIIVALEMVIELNARGFEFLAPDLYRSEAAVFTVEDNALRCPFTSLGGFGEQAAQSIVEERGKARFLSEEDLKKRTKITAAGIEMLRACGGLGALAESDQISFF